MILSYLYANIKWFFRNTLTLILDILINNYKLKLSKSSPVPSGGFHNHTKENPPVLSQNSSHLKSI